MVLGWGECSGSGEAEAAVALPLDLRGFVAPRLGGIVAVGAGFVEGLSGVVLFPTRGPESGRLGRVEVGRIMRCVWRWRPLIAAPADTVFVRETT